MRRDDRPDLRRGLLLPFGLAGALGLAGCDTPAPTVASTPAPTPAPAIANVAPQAPVTEAGDTDTSTNQTAGPAVITLQNDPSAPANSPLCGTAAREYDALSQSLMPRLYAEAGQCAAYACYDAATATYLGADGYRHVCR